MHSRRVGSFSDVLAACGPHFRVGVLWCFSEFSWLPNRPRALCNDFVSYKWIMVVSCTFVFCSYISAKRFLVCFFQESIFGSSDVYGADDFPRFSACSRDDGALCTRWRVGSLVSWLSEGLKAFGGCLVLLGCFFRIE